MQNKTAKSLITKELEQKLSATGSVGQMYNILVDTAREAVSSGKITVEDLYSDVPFASAYAFACNNISTYDLLFSSVFLCFKTESAAMTAGAGTSGAFFYRYAYALRMTGHLEESLRKLDLAVRLDPDYPWAHQDRARILSCAGRTEEALAEAEIALKLAPDDHNVRALKDDILSGASLEQMFFHYSDADADAQLQEGCVDEHDFLFRQSVSGMRVDKDGLSVFMQIFSLCEEQLPRDPLDPYINFDFNTPAGAIQISFEMNRALASKIDRSFLLSLKERLLNGDFDQSRKLDGREGSPGSLMKLAVTPDLELLLTYRKDFSDELKPALLERLLKNKSVGSGKIFAFDMSFAEMVEAADTFILQLNQSHKVMNRHDRAEALALYELYGSDDGSARDSDRILSRRAFSAAVLLRDAAFDFEGLQQRLKDSLEDVKDAKRTSDSLRFNTRDQEIELHLIDGAFPDPDLPSAAENFTLWHDGLRTVALHRAHLMLSVKRADSDPEDVLSRMSKAEAEEKKRLLSLQWNTATVFARVYAACCEDACALSGVMNGSPDSKEIIIGGAEDIDTDPPGFKASLIRINLYREEDGNVLCYTEGMQRFGMYDMELTADAPLPVLYGVMVKTCSFALANADFFRDKDTATLPELEGRFVMRLKDHPFENGEQILRLTREA